MNVLNIVYNFTTGGVERLLIDVANKLAEKGHKSIVCIINDCYEQKLVDQFNSKVKVIHLKRSKIRKIGYLKQILNIIHSENIEAVHVHQGTLMSFYMLLKLLCPKVRFYFTVHDTYIFSDLKKKDRKISNIICSRLIAISDAVVDDIKKYGVDEKKIKRIYNGVDFKKFTPVIKEKGSVINIVNVARFFPEKKGQDILIRAAAILKAKGYCFKVIFAGGELNKSSAEIPKMKKLAKELNIENEVEFLGNVDNVPKVLAQADIFCIPSRYEGFGISAVEAMAMGLPCVASDIIGLNEVVNDSALGELFTMGDEDDLADKLMYVIENYEKYSADEISSNVIGRFSIKKMADELIDTYNS